MSIFFVGMSSFTSEKTKLILQQVQQLQSAVLDYFWISDVGAPDRYDLETARKFGFDVRSAFLVQWNKEGGSEFIPSIPKLLYEAFGRENLLVFDLDRELVR